MKLEKIGDMGQHLRYGECVICETKSDFLLYCRSGVAVFLCLPCFKKTYPIAYAHLCYWCKKHPPEQAEMELKGEKAC